MPIEVVEKFESRRVIEGANPSAELRFNIFGTNIELDARTALKSIAPLAYNMDAAGTILLPAQSYEVEPVGENWWEGTVQYALSASVSEHLLSFDSTGGTSHITQSLETKGRYAPAGQTAPDFKGAIGVTGESVEGVDITVQIFQFSERHVIPAALVTNAYIRTIRELTGKLNNAPFKTYAAGEVLFLGASGQRQGMGDWDIDYHFAASVNVDYDPPTKPGLTVGDITGIVKGGWDYLWVRYEESEDTAAKSIVKRPKAVYVERVYDLADFSLLGIGT